MTPLPLQSSYNFASDPKPVDRWETPLMLGGKLGRKSGHRVFSCSMPAGSFPLALCLLSGLYGSSFPLELCDTGQP
jgi:hypothetical protein